MAKTLFEKIIDRELPGTIVYEDEQCFVIKDIRPAAPVHLLVITRKVIPKLSDSTVEDEAVLGHAMRVACKVAKEAGLEDYRVIVNNGAGAGQSVFHLHLHVVGGRPLSWPPG